MIRLLESLVLRSASERVVREQEIVVSTPNHPGGYEICSGGSCAGTGRRLLIAQTQVRFLLPEPYEI